MEPEARRLKYPPTLRFNSRSNSSLGALVQTTCFLTKVCPSVLHLDFQGLCCFDKLQARFAPSARTRVTKFFSMMITMSFFLSNPKTATAMNSLLFLLASVSSEANHFFQSSARPFAPCPKEKPPHLKSTNITATVTVAIHPLRPVRSPSR